MENVQLKLAHINLDTASLSSVGLGDPFLDGGNLDATMESNMEGWLQVPSKQNIRRSVIDFNSVHISNRLLIPEWTFINWKTQALICV